MNTELCPVIAWSLSQPAIEASHRYITSNSVCQVQLNNSSPQQTIVEPSIRASLAKTLFISNSDNIKVAVPRTIAIYCGASKQRLFTTAFISRLVHHCYMIFDSGKS